MKNRFLWILCALLSLLVLTGGCNRKPASTADVPRSLSHQYKIAVAPFTQPRDISQLIMGHLGGGAKLDLVGVPAAGPGRP